jgi:hypothetical protein
VASARCWEADKTAQADEISKGDDHHLWSPRVFPVIQAPPPKVRFISEFFVDAILPHIVATKQAGGHHRRLILHMDNASPDRARLTDFSTNRSALALVLCCRISWNWPLDLNPD